MKFSNILVINSWPGWLFRSHILSQSFSEMPRAPLAINNGNSFQPSSFCGDGKFPRIYSNIKLSINFAAQTLTRAKSNTSPGSLQPISFSVATARIPLEHARMSRKMVEICFLRVMAVATGDTKESQEFN